MGKRPGQWGQSCSVAPGGLGHFPNGAQETAVLEGLMGFLLCVWHWPGQATEQPTRWGQLSIVQRRVSLPDWLSCRRQEANFCPQWLRHLKSCQRQCSQVSAEWPTLLTSPGLPGTWEQRRHVLIIRPQASGLCLSQAGCAQVCKNRLPTPSARGWWDTHTISRPGLLGGKFLHLPIVIIKEIIIKTVHGGWTFCQRKRNSFQGTNTSPIERA